MKRGHTRDGLADRVMKVAGTLLMVGSGVLLLSHFSAVRRYLRMKRMSASHHPRPPGTLTASADTPPRWGTTHWPLH
jgi:hypothetical protein